MISQAFSLVFSSLKGLHNKTRGNVPGYQGIPTPGSGCKPDTISL